ncbi:HYR domain-containing protein [Antarcticibacterium arcticum]|uniref:HYR domain-containing protein n=1 Tax=Antarcticibacterium arcticum TaxID=2585771 RepID=A0A5B8YER8_9FLAO|nr:HYR domain-containing protein [Antarcticibacterium arcticum]QED36395.1 HYR domain-containing protein [Antarcticibacterium arcticum]
MSGSPTEKTYMSSLSPNFIGQGNLWFILGVLFFFMGVTQVRGQDPTYAHVEERQMENINVTFADALNIEQKVNRVIISVDVNPQGEVFVLTFGNGIKKVGSSGQLIDFIPNSGGRLNSPMDFAINSEGKFYVAVNSGSNKSIRVFSATGVFLASENIGTGAFGTGPNYFKGPVGVAFDVHDNLFIADHYTGSETNVPQPSRVKIYTKGPTGSYVNRLLTEFHQVEGEELFFAYRIAADSQGYIYVAEQGNSTGNARIQVIKLDNNNIPKRIAIIGGVGDQIGSPGSLYIDRYDYLHAADFGNEVSMTSILEAGNDPFKLFEIFEPVKRGIQNNVFKINIYKDFEYTGAISEEIDFPIDFALNSCDKLFVNNAILSGTTGSPPFYFGLNATMDFDLEIYKRTPSFDTEEPEITNCSPDITVPAPAGQTFAIVQFDTPTAGDNCSTVTVTQTLGLASNSQFPIGIHNIQFTATDEAGNSSDCTFTITVTGEVPPAPTVFENCPGNISVSTTQGICGASVTFSTPNAYDGNGPVQVVLTSEIGSGEIFPVGESTVIFEATGEDGIAVKCSFKVTVIDNIKPTISCPPNTSVNADSNGNFTLPNYTGSATASDNCGVVSVTQLPLPGTNINEDTEINLTATDEAGNKSICTFTVSLTQQPAPKAECLNITIDLDNTGKAVITPGQIYDGDAVQDGVTLTLNKENFTCEDLGANQVILTVTGSNGVSSSCTATVTVRDNTPPTVQCPASNYIIQYEGEKEVVIPNFSAQFNPSDNCTQDLIITQDPQPGTIVTQDTWIRFTVEDEAGAQSGCAFWVILEDSRQLNITCPEDKIYTAEANCGTTMPDFRGEVTVNIPPARITQHPEPGFPINGSTNVTFTAVYEDQRVSCTIKYTMQDTTFPVFDCVADQTETVEDGEGFSLPNYILQLDASDNCWIASFKQVPDVGTVVFNDTEITLSATDDAGNTTECSFTLTIEEESNPDPPTFDCLIGEIILPPNENCEFIVGNYEVEGVSNFRNFTNESVFQNIAPGTEILEDILIILDVRDEGISVGTCEFWIRVEEVSPPVITCPGTQTEFYNPEEGFVLPDYRNLAEVTGDCGIAGITQTPSPGTIINVNTQVQLIVTSNANLVSQCEFMVNLSEEEVLEISCIEDQEEEINENCELVVPDYTSLASVNFENATVTQSPVPGTAVSGNTTIRLTATLNGETDECSFLLTTKDSTPPVAVCVTDFELQLNENGTASINAADFGAQSTDNCEIVSMSLDKTIFTTADIGENTVILTVTDASGYTDTCQALVNVLPYEGTTNPNFTCRTEVTLSLDSTGNAILEASNLYTGDAADKIFTLSKANFNCSNLGNNEVTLSWTGSDGPGSCVIKVVVKDEIPPVVRTRNISMFLSQTGQVQLSAFLFDAGFSDNCGPVTFSIDKTSLSCKDLGDNTITLTVTDASGNVSTGTAIVSLTGNCEEPGEPGEDRYEYIYIYPNPTTGPITFWTPANTKIEKVEVYDQRGRFIMMQLFPESVLRYQMDLSGLQQAVYILHLFTSDGNKIIRVIIK